MIKYKCIKCGAALESPSSLARKEDTCPVCGQVGVVPALKSQAPVILGICGGTAALVGLVMAAIVLFGGRPKPAELASAPPAEPSRAQPTPTESPATPTPQTQPLPSASQETTTGSDDGNEAPPTGQVPSTSQGKQNTPSATDVGAVTDPVAPVYTDWPFDAEEAARRQNETADALHVQKDLALDCGNGVSLKLVLIPAGRYMMGEDESLREVVIAKPFYMGAYEVTQEQFEQVVGSTSASDGRKNHPMGNTTWFSARDFCDQLAKNTGTKVRLPKEAEWEYACRAGSSTMFCFGDDEEGLGAYAWHMANSGDTPGSGMGRHPVGEKKPNAWGLHDMHGNLREWCQEVVTVDGYYVYSEGRIVKGYDAVVRGGWYGSAARACRSAARSYENDGQYESTVGFRVVMDVMDDSR